ncbi:MAG: flavodoxin-dependent (E)-4-hydroxy-3-methylbut-2-enyl-diphosphate synthase [Eubacteriales bacterium]
MKKKVYCGDVAIGGDASISVQSMLNVNTADVKAVNEQIARLYDCGCEIVRLAVPNMEAADAISQIKKQSKLPIVADIHFDYRLAIAAIENGADKIRINPGNIGNREKLEKIVIKAKERKIPIRVGVNSGSLEQEFFKKYGKVTPQGLCESAKKNVEILESLNFDDIVVSIKSSDVKQNYEAHKLADKMLDYPLHIGLTESGSKVRGGMKSAIGIGSLLLEGIGNTMRVSLTADPVEEVKLAYEILRSVGLRNFGINLVSCPTCGRTKIDLENLVSRIEEKLPQLEAERVKKGLPPITIAVMGCEVNGPGEAKEADFGIAAGKGKAAIFSKGKIIKNVYEKDILNEIFTILT